MKLKEAQEHEEYLKERVEHYKKRRLLRCRSDFTFLYVDGALTAYRDALRKFRKYRKKAG